MLDKKGRRAKLECEQRKLLREELVCDQESVNRADSKREILLNVVLCMALYGRVQQSRNCNCGEIGEGVLEVGFSDKKGC